MALADFKTRCNEEGQGDLNVLRFASKQALKLRSRKLGEAWRLHAERRVPRDRGPFPKVHTPRERPTWAGDMVLTGSPLSCLLIHIAPGQKHGTFSVLYL